jgi:hypothetical protein
MKIAKRTLHVNKEELRKLFGLPEDIEIMAVRPSRGWNDEQSFEFLLVSAGEVVVNDYPITQVINSEFGLQRRIGLETLNRIMNGEEVHTGGYTNGDWYANGGATIITEPMNIQINIEDQKKNPNDVAKEIIKGLDRINKKGGK